MGTSTLLVEREFHALRTHTHMTSTASRVCALTAVVRRPGLGLALEVMHWPAINSPFRSLSPVVAVVAAAIRAPARIIMRLCAVGMYVCMRAMAMARSTA